VDQGIVKRRLKATTRSGDDFGLGPDEKGAEGPCNQSSFGSISVRTGAAVSPGPI
jgi:hypothetical protein